MSSKSIPKKSIYMDEEKIRALAYEFSQEPKSYDVYIWLMAEIELKLKNAVNISDAFKVGMPKMITIDPSKVLDRIDENRIKSLAEFYAHQNFSLEEVHWHLAIRRYIYNEAKKK